jgi:hypothetical protein
MAKGAILREQWRATRRRTFVRQGPEPQKYAGGSCPLRLGHMLITLLLHTFLTARLDLLAGGNDGDPRGAPHEYCGAHQVTHGYSFPWSFESRDHQPDIVAHDEQVVLAGSEFGPSVPCTADRSIQIHRLLGDLSHADFPGFASDSWKS